MLTHFILCKFGFISFKTIDNFNTFFVKFVKKITNAYSLIFWIKTLVSLHWIPHKILIKNEINVGLRFLRGWKFDFYHFIKSGTQIQISDKNFVTNLNLSDTLSINFFSRNREITILKSDNSSSFLIRFHFNF